MKLVLTIAFAAIAILFAGLGWNSVSQQSQITRLTHQVRTDNAQLATQEARLSGDHRDTITCNDLLGFDLTSYWQDSSYLLQSSPIPLPAHCINR
jgi:hypothetical protein